MNRLLLVLALASCKEKEQKPAAAPPPPPAPVAPAPPKLPEPDAAPAPAADPDLATRKELPATCTAWREQIEKLKTCPSMQRRIESMRRGYAALETGWAKMELDGRTKLVADCQHNADELASAAKSQCP
jgi:hypothetical protein